MSIPLGGVVTTSCDDIEDGTPINLFDLNCTRILSNAADGNAFEGHVPRADLKTSYIAFELARQLTVCDQDDFAREGYPLTMRVKLKIKCPFTEGPVSYQVRVQYGEATNPVNGITSDFLVETKTWDEGTTSSGTYTTAAITAPWAGTYSSDGVGVCSITVEQIDPDPLNTCGTTTVRVTATLERFGRPYDFLSGSVVVQVQDIPCEAFVTGTGASGFWTGVAFPAGPIGLVMTMEWHVEPIV